MRINSACMTCEAAVGYADRQFYSMEVRNDGFYQFTCKAGHVSVICLQELDFEVLPELAVNAIIDGYFREAVASFTAGMERYFEFYVRVLARAHKIPLAELATAWSHIKKQSERQLGAYIFSYLLDQGVSPPLLSNTKIEFRNSVIHRGYIPSREEAIAYGNVVLAVVLPSLTALLTKHGPSIREEVVAHMAEISVAARKRDVKLSGMSIPTPVSLSRAPNFMDLSIEDSIERVLAMRRNIRAAQN